jgi:hypothetical protein
VIAAAFRDGLNWFGSSRISWHFSGCPQKDGVRETAEISSDSGKTWKPLFDIMFRAHKR